MSNKKLFGIFLSAAAFLVGCKISTIPFSGTNIDAPFFSNITKIWGNPSLTRIDSIVIYKARLQEEPVDRDGIPELKLINTESKQTRSNIAMLRNYQELYLCQVFTNKKSERLCVFFSSGFDVHDSCTSLGPAYLGVIRMEQINFKKELKLAVSKSGYNIISGKPDSILFIARHDIPATHVESCDDEGASDSLCNIRIKEIINLNTNKIGGTKPVIYPIEKIFSDPDALLFKYFTTLKP